ncbi:hypothetical protein D3C71_832030 [compost metagenome]
MGLGTNDAVGAQALVALEGLDRFLGVRAEFAVHVQRLAVAVGVAELVQRFLQGLHVAATAVFAQRGVRGRCGLLRRGVRRRCALAGSSATAAVLDQVAAGGQRIGGKQLHAPRVLAVQVALQRDHLHAFATTRLAHLQLAIAGIAHHHGDVVDAVEAAAVPALGTVVFTDDHALAQCAGGDFLAGKQVARTLGGLLDDAGGVVVARAVLLAFGEHGAPGLFVDLGHALVGQTHHPARAVHRAAFRALVAEAVLDVVELLGQLVGTVELDAIASGSRCGRCGRLCRGTLLGGLGRGRSGDGGSARHGGGACGHRSALCLGRCSLGRCSLGMLRRLRAQRLQGVTTGHAIHGQAVVALEVLHRMTGVVAIRTVGTQRLAVAVGVAQRVELLLQLLHRRAAFVGREHAVGHRITCRARRCCGGVAERAAGQAARGFVGVALVAIHVVAHLGVGTLQRDAAIAVQRRVAGDHLAAQHAVHARIGVVAQLGQEADRIGRAQVVHGVDIGVHVLAAVLRGALDVLAGEFGQHARLQLGVLAQLGRVGLLLGHVRGIGHAVLFAVLLHHVVPGAIEELAVAMRRGNGLGAVVLRDGVQFRLGGGDRPRVRIEAGLEAGDLHHHVHVDPGGLGRRFQFLPVRCPAFVPI